MILLATSQISKIPRNFQLFVCLFGIYCGGFSLLEDIACDLCNLYWHKLLFFFYFGWHFIIDFNFGDSCLSRILNNNEFESNIFKVCANKCQFFRECSINAIILIISPDATLSIKFIILAVNVADVKTEMSI